jgi:hypothetical protein
MAGSLVGGIAATFFGQAAIDTAGAFLGAFAFVCAAGVLAPSHHARVTLGAVCLVATLAIFSFVLSTFTTVEDFANLSTRERLLTPLAQLLGALYALFILPPLMTPHTTLDRLWREIFTLGTFVAMFGALVAVIGIVLALLGRSAIVLGVGFGILVLGAVTRYFPFVHLAVRLKKKKPLMDAATGPEIGREIPWTEVVQQVFRVREFDRTDTTIDDDDKVRATSPFTPYGYLLVESPILDQPTRLPIVHSDDFRLAASVFDEPKLVEIVAEQELLVTYAPKHLLPKGLAGGTTHALHYVITERGTLQRYYDSEGGVHRAQPALEKLFGQFIYEGEIRVQLNRDPEL